MDCDIRIVPINTVDHVFLDRLAPCLEERFIAGARVERSLVVPRSTLNATRGQLFVSTLIAKVQRAHPEPGTAVLAITDFDLYKTSHRFVFGDADETQAIAVVSVHRLRSDFYGEATDFNVLFQRTLKECVHELGHTFGLVHCSEPTCAMSLATHIELVDSKAEQYCARCGLRLVERFSREGGV